MVPLITNGTNSKIYNGTIEKTPNALYIMNQLDILALADLSAGRIAGPVVIFPKGNTIRPSPWQQLMKGP